MEQRPPLKLRLSPLNPTVAKLLFWAFCAFVAASVCISVWLVSGVEPNPALLPM